ncbi:MAG: hypothetical protein IIU39_05130, partial [Ruminococcus sp.]|nr:hypothetical protein [Ruminococcus sp.]
KRFKWVAFSHDSAYEVDNRTTFVTKDECYNDMRNAVLEKMKWNTEHDEDFAECRKLNKITVPKTVKKIGRYALGYVNYYDGDYDRNDNLVIKGYKNSAAQKYAKNNGFVFKKIK